MTKKTTALIAGFAIIAAIVPLAFTACNRGKSAAAPQIAAPETAFEFEDGAITGGNRTATTAESKLPPRTRIEIGPESMWNNPDIRIWGWSKNGNVALSTEEDSNAGIAVVQFSIINLVTDETIFNLNNDDAFRKLSSDELNEDYNASDFYEAEMSAILAAMKNNGIVEHHTPLLAFPLVIDNFNYTALVRVTEENEDEKTFDIIVSRNGKEKTVSTVTIPSYFSEDNIIGYFKSPFENRILVVSGATKSSHSVSYRISGCHLNVGFN